MFHGGPGGFFRPGGPGRPGGRFDDDESLGRIYDSRVIARLPRYLLPVKKWLGIGAVGMLIRTLATLATPYLVAIATNNIVRGDLSGLNIVSLIFVIIAVVLWFGQYWENLYLSYAGQSVIYRMRTELFAHLHRLSLSFFDRNKVGKLMSRVQNDVQQLQELVTQGILSLITSLLTLLGIAIIMLTMNWRLGLIMLTMVPVMILAVWIWQKYARQAFL
ncbi:MAG: ABC transporter transmembrane domain-containing protein, partial [Dehalococcoidales bacterium]|nr:ABC transporter transmembrane domain-containing protein [Dehalococcoidales bacterium]